MAAKRRTARVYGLVDPRSGEVRYVGMTSLTLEGRRGWHFKDTRKCPRVAWIQELLSQGLAPLIILLEEAPSEKTALLRERWWIAHGREMGWSLLNGSDGGEEGHPGRYNNKPSPRQQKPARPPRTERK